MLSVGLRLLSGLTAMESLSLGCDDPFTSFEPLSGLQRLTALVFQTSNSAEPKVFVRENTIIMQILQL